MVGLVDGLRVGGGLRCGGCQCVVLGWLLLAAVGRACGWGGVGGEWLDVVAVG